MESKWISDKRAEEEHNIFLEKNLYPWVCQRYGYPGFRPISDREMQRKGVDVVFYRKNGTEARIDVKTTFYYKSRGNFCMELLYRGRDGEDKLGWFLNHELLTDCYFLTFPEFNVDVSRVRAEDFESTEVVVASKKRLYDYLKENGVTKERLVKRAIEIRRSGRTGRFPVIDGRYIDGVFIYATPEEQMNEAPINLIIKKEKCSEICSGHYMVTQRGTKIIQ